MALRLGDEDLVETHEINLTPFIDVMLVLLIIFMVAAPLATVSVPVDLPAASAAAVKPPDHPLVLSLTADHSLALGDESIPRDALAAALDRASGGDKDRRIFLRADKSVDYGAMMELIDALRAAGYLKLALVAREDAMRP